MAYKTDLAGAARRHLRAANELHVSAAAGAQPGCRAVAGYLYGLTGELAVKVMMRDSGLKPLDESARREDPYYAHFPGLKSRLMDVATGRRAGELRKIAEDSKLFQNWDTKMRYAPTEDVQEQWIASWRAAAEALIARMELG